MVEQSGRYPASQGRSAALRVEPAAQSQAEPATTNALEGDVFPPRSTDDEASALLDELSNLQTWCIMQARHDRSASEAFDLVQRTRCFILERCRR